MGPSKTELSDSEANVCWSDFDYVAGQISIRHVLHLGQTADYLRRYGCFMVTASCDRLDMLRPLADPITGIVADLVSSWFKR